MALDIKTLVFVLGLTHVIQFVVFIHQYRVNRTLRGVGCWLLWSGVEVLAFTCMLLRAIPAIQPAAIIAQNGLLVLGVMFFYVGILRFLGGQENRRLLLSIYAAYLAGLCYLLFGQDDFNARGALISFTLALFAFLSARALLVNKTRPIASSANLLAAVCIAHGTHFAFRLVVQITAPPPADFFAPTLFNGTALLDGIIVGLLWTFGTILLITQRLNAEMKTANEEMELVFNTSPDAAVISRLSDGLIVNINDGFLALTGFRREECIGKTTLAVNAWSNPADREAVVRKLREEGSCRSYEAVFQRKDGSALYGLMSAAVFELQDVPHVISVIRDINERKQAEKTLRQSRQAALNLMTDAVEARDRAEQASQTLRASEARYRGLLANIEAGVVVHAPDTSIIMHNSRAAELLGLSDAQIVGKESIDPAWCFLDERGNSLPVEEYPVSQIIRNRKAIKDFVLGIKRPVTNVIVWLSVNGIPVLDHKGELCESVISFVDITERRKAEKALQLTRFSVESVSDALFWITPDARFVDVNAAACRSLGYTREELLQLSVFDIDPHYNVENSLKRFAKLRQLGSMIFESEHRTKDGRLFPVEIVSNYIKSGSEERDCAFVRDITERKQAEVSILHLNAELLIKHRDLLTAHQSAESLLERLKIATRAAHIGIWDWNIVDNVLIGDDIICDIYGIPRGSFDADYMSWRKGLHPDDWARIDEDIQAAIRGEREYAPEFRIILPDGTIRNIKANSQVFFADGKPIRMVGTNIDITGRKREEEEREKLQAQLSQSQKMESVGRLAGGVAHDFNNLLMGIMGYADLCKEAVGKEGQLRAWLDEITGEAQRSANLTRQLLAFARKQAVAPKVVDLNDVVGNMLKMLRRLIGEDIDLVWQPGAEPWSVKIDPGQVDQILANLCVNARDAIGGAGKITIETDNISIDANDCAEQVEAEPGSYVRLVVSDDGCGMDRETLKNIFEPFFTTKPVGEGTGLGLATVYGIVKQNNGFINVYSEPGSGTSFRIYLPRDTSGSKIATEAETKVESQGGSETILLVEDENAIRITLRLFLERFGYTVIAAESPAVALRLAAEHRGGIDLMITDVIMPGMSGRELAKKMTVDRPSMKILYMSGYTADVIAQRGILEDGVQFIGKPIGRDALMQKVREVLG